MLHETRNKKLLGAPGIATRSKDATLGAPGLTRNKKPLGDKKLPSASQQGLMDMHHSCSLVFTIPGRQACLV